MPANRDQNRAKGSSDKKSRSHREEMRALLLPASEAPANDNERGLYWAARSLVLRHLHWLVPTLLLALVSLVLLSIG